MAALDTLKGFLNEAGLKFVPVDERTVALLFKGDARDQIIIQLRAAENLIIALTSVPDHGNEEKVLHSLLRATMDTDMMKAFSNQDDVLLACEVPLEHVRKGNLEGVVRQLVQAVDVKPEVLRDLEQYQKAAMVGTLICRQASGPLYSGPAAAAIPGYCQALGSECVRIDDTKFRLTSPGTILKLNIVVICRETLVTFLAFTDLKVDGSPKAFYHRLLDLNRRVNVARVAMDKKDELCFLYEVPGLNQQTFQQAVQTLEQCVALHVMGGSTAGQTPTPASKPERKGFLDRLFKR